MNMHRILILNIQFAPTQGTGVNRNSQLDRTQHDPYHHGGHQLDFTNCQQGHALQSIEESEARQSASQARTPSPAEEGGGVRSLTPRSAAEGKCSSDHRADERMARDDVDDERMLPVKVEYPAQSEEAAEGAEPGLDNVHFDMGRLHDLFAPYMNEEVPPSAPTDEPPNPNQEPHPDQGNSVPEDPATQPGNQPRTLITTSPRPSEFTLAFVHELGGLFGGSRNCDVIPRKTKRFELTRVCRWACERGYASMVVIGEAHGGRNRSGPTHMTISRLPYGPTASFRMTSIVPSKAIPGHAKPTSHFPELVLSNFSTPLGLSIGTLLQSVFPPLPELEDARW
ncbi:hypothetical protein PCASD_07281 [Puccinia coronata f. sp. avenae]|uniref:Brix domain-containing protein n=1 Tax=Puccinia coronata f. sp. avenae TaxID=200324 RepID=A0A2N5URG9_9BASI|nr:hypothetical protein PCASD_07281 [Puccinia coronata f. sp. avenae]